MFGKYYSLMLLLLFLLLMLVMGFFFLSIPGSARYSLREEAVKAALPGVTSVEGAVAKSSPF